MLYQGDFVTQGGRRVTVRIVTGGDRSQTETIGEGHLFFAPGPVQIDDQTNDIFDVMQPRTARITLLSEAWLPDMFAANPLDNPVEIEVDGELEFAGFVEPQAYSQPFNERYDTVELNCLDALAALQWLRYRDAGSAWAPHATVAASCTVRSFADIIGAALDPLLSRLDLTGRHTPSVVWDNSMMWQNVMQVLGASESLFVGADEDEVWTSQQTLEAVLRYLDLHAAAVGTTIRLYSWKSLQEGRQIQWVDVRTSEQTGEPATVRNVMLDRTNARGLDATLGMSECWNRITVSCDVREYDSMADNPLDSEHTDSGYAAAQKYLTEYTVDKECNKSNDGYLPMWKTMHGKEVWCKGYKVTDWYLRVLRHPKWRFRINNGMWSDPSSMIRQHEVSQRFRWPGEAALVQWRKVERDMSGSDTSPAESTSEAALVIGTTGSFADSEGWGAVLESFAPVAEYTDSSAAALTPSDNDTVNYIVFEGSMVLNPDMPETRSARDVYNDTIFSEMVLGGLGCLYTRQWWKADTPLSQPEPDWDAQDGLLPYNGWWPESIKYNYSATGDSTDRIKRLPVLACMLVIGDKCLVESERSDGTCSHFWMPYKERGLCKDDDEYYAQSFTIGIDPAIGDNIVGAEHDIENTVSYGMNIDAKGLAIPIHKGDNVSGPVRFAILGAVNLVWNDITRRHRTWFRSEKWTTNAVALLDKITNIQLRGFQVRVCSNNGGRQTLQGKDLVYTSDDGERFLNPKEDIAFALHSALTPGERDELGVADRPSQSCVIDMRTNAGVTSETFGDRTNPEQRYVRAYHAAACRPCAELEQRARLGTMSRWDLMTHPALGVPMLVVRRSLSLMEDEEQLSLRERKEGEV